LHVDYFVQVDYNFLMFTEHNSTVSVC